MANKAKLREILDILSPEVTVVEKHKEIRLKKRIQQKTLENVDNQLARFKRNVETEIKQVAQEVSKLGQLAKVERNKTSFKIVENDGTIVSLRNELDALKAQKDSEIENLQAANALANSSVVELRTRLDRMDEEEVTELDIVTPLRQEIEALRTDLTSKMANLPHRGGSMNRNIAIGGNTSVLSRYTDINLKAGSNITLSYAYNNATKYTDVTFTAAGAAGTAVIGEDLSSQAPTSTPVLAHTPLAGTLALYRGGSRQQQGAPPNDYTLSGPTITLLSPIQTGEVLLADYSY